jgi:cell division protein FtsW (lipid II flippase)
MGLIATGSFLASFSGDLSESQFLDPQERQEQAQIAQSASAWSGGSALALLIYIVLLIVTFTTKQKHVKALGIVFLVVGFIAVIATIGWGLIPYALLIPAGVLAIREAKLRGKEEEEVQKRVTTEEQRTETGGERKRSSSFTEGWGDDKK